MAAETTAAGKDGGSLGQWWLAVMNRSSNRESRFITVQKPKISPIILGYLGQNTGAPIPAPKTKNWISIQDKKAAATAAAPFWGAK